MIKIFFYYPICVLPICVLQCISVINVLRLLMSQDVQVNENFLCDIAAILIVAVKKTLY